MTERDRRLLRSASFVPVEAKLRRPTRPGPLVDRPRLLRQLLASHAAPVVGVVAPPGYGKTVLLSQWAELDARPFAWLSADSGDDDAGILATYLFMALHRVAPVGPDVLDGLDPRHDAPVALATARLAAELPRRKPFVLVVEDAHRLRSRDARAVLRSVASCLPADSQLVLVARGTPLPDTGTDTPVTLGTEQLRFDRAEARALAETLAVAAGDDTLHDILDRTEGWPAAVYLAMQAGSWERGLPLVADYIRHEVLRALSASDTGFLVSASVADELSGPFCDAMLGTSGSARRLQRLAQSTLLLHRTATGNRFRMHRTLRDVLRAELQRRHPEDVSRLHGSASEWFEATGELVQATSHALASHDLPRAARLTWSQTPLLVAAGQAEVVQERLDAFGPRQVAAYAYLSLSAAWCALARGDSIDHWLTAAERGDYDGERRGEAESVAAGVAVTRGAAAAGGVQQMTADARLATRLLDPADPLGCTAQLLVALGSYLAGPGEQADAMFAVTARVAQACAAYDVQAVAVAERAMVALDRGDVDAADGHAAAAGRVMGDHGLVSLAVMLPVVCVVAALAADRGAADAHTLVASAAARLAGAPAIPAWSGVQCRCVLARAYLDLDEPAAARSLLSRAQTMLGSVTDAPVLQEAVEALWQRLQVSPVDGPGAATLTAAELRVLQFLPTYLSFEEIGRRLFLSRNTVKTQAVAAYRKLGVSSRSEAVERAEALGLITADTTPEQVAADLQG